MKKLVLLSLGLLAFTAMLSPIVPASPLMIGAGLVGLVMLMPDLPKGSLYMAIPTQDARNLFTKALVAVYKEQISPKTFLMSFFKPKESMTKEISIEVRRGTEKVASNVQRYSDGNYNKFSNSTEKIFVPPYFYEWLAANDHRLYDAVIAGGTAPMFAQLASELAEDLGELKNKIIRAYEKMCADIFNTGQITLIDGTVINFNRKSASIVDKGAGAYWATGTVNPFTDLENGCKFLRKTGKMNSPIVNAIFGEECLEAFLTNTIVKERADLLNVNVMSINAPEWMAASGAVLHGQVSCGAWKVNIWTYPEYYEATNGTITPYIPAKKIVMLPPNPQFVMAYGAVPQLIGPSGEIPQKGAYLVGEFMDHKKTSHEIFIKSAGVPVPVQVDCIYTLQVVEN